MHSWLEWNPKRIPKVWKNFVIQWLSKWFKKRIKTEQIQVIPPDLPPPIEKPRENIFDILEQARNELEFVPDLYPL
jgi:hypothetical protein